MQSRPLGSARPRRVVEVSLYKEFMTRGKQTDDTGVVDDVVKTSAV